MVLEHLEGLEHVYIDRVDIWYIHHTSIYLDSCTNFKISGRWRTNNFPTSSWSCEGLGCGGWTIRGRWYQALLMGNRDQGPWRKSLWFKKLRMARKHTHTHTNCKVSRLAPKRKGRCLLRVLFTSIKTMGYPVSSYLSLGDFWSIVVVDFSCHFVGETPRWLTYDRLLLDCWLTWTILDCLGWFENKNDVKDLGCISVRDSCCFPEASERCWAHNLRPGDGGGSQSQVMEVRKLVAGLEFLDVYIYIYEYMNIWIYVW